MGLDWKNAGDGIFEQRFLAHWSQKDLADTAGVSQTTICRAERGQCRNFDTMLKIYRALGKTRGALHYRLTDDERQLELDIEYPVNAK